MKAPMRMNYDLRFSHKYVCNLCDKQYKTGKGARRHLIEVHPDSLGQLGF